MKTTNDVKQFWSENNNVDDSHSALSDVDLKLIIKTKMKKEKKTIAEYFWAAFTYQVFIYSYMCHLLIKYWGNTEIAFLALGLILIYLPYTLMLYKKIKAIFLPATNAKNSPIKDVQSNINGKYHLLFVFFRFKKWFDRIVNPLACFILTAIVFQLYVSGGMEENIIAAIITFLTALSLFIIATYYENKKRFTIPLRHFKAILEDIKENN